MKKWVFLVALLFLLACTTKTIIPVDQKVTTEQTAAQEVQTTANHSGIAAFKITQSQARRAPPTINGTVKNIGTATGSVKIIARVYYASVVSAEKTQIIEDIKPDETKRFNFDVDPSAQWGSYTAIAEKI